MPFVLLSRDPETLDWAERCAASAEIYTRPNRLFRVFIRRTTALAKAAHPATSGNECLCLNWGNEESRRIWRDGWRRWDRLSRRLDAIYDALWANRQAA